MSSLRNIRNRIRSVENIKQITRTMEMVASARLLKAQMKAKQSLPYMAKLREILQIVASAPDIDALSPFFEQREIKKTGLVIIGADKGLCGAYNSNLIQAADRFLHQYASSDIELILVGHKMVQHYRWQKWVIGSTLAPWSGKLTSPMLNAFTHLLVDEFLTGDLDIIYLVYTQYHGILNREVIIEKFLPIEKETTTEKKALGYLFEPSPDEIYEDLLPRYCKTKLQAAFHQAYASELAARILSMKTASQNAEEMIDHLTLTRNKLRQEGITREMLEITMGAGN